MKLIRWISGFFEDQGDSASAKRLILYIFTFFYYLEVKADIAGAEVDETTMYSTIAVILFTLGAVTSEFITKVLGNRSKATPKQAKGESE